jgi:hypothetical protein
MVSTTHVDEGMKEEGSLIWVLTLRWYPVLPANVSLTLEKRSAVSDI